MTKKPKILYVEDDKIDRLVLERSAQDFDIELVTCSCASKVQEMTNAPFAAAIIDWNLGDGTGDEVAQHLRQLSGALPIVFVSGIFSDVQLDAAKEFSPVACLEKSGDPDFPEALISQLLSGLKPLA